LAGAARRNRSDGSAKVRSGRAWSFERTDWSAEKSCRCGSISAIPRRGRRPRIQARPASLNAREAITFRRVGNSRISSAWASINACPCRRWGTRRRGHPIAHPIGCGSRFLSLFLLSGRLAEVSFPDKPVSAGFPSCVQIERTRVLQRECVPYEILQFNQECPLRGRREFVFRPHLTAEEGRRLFCGERTGVQCPAPRGNPSSGNRGMGRLTGDASPRVCRSRAMTSFFTSPFFFRPRISARRKSFFLDVGNKRS